MSSEPVGVAPSPQPEKPAAEPPPARDLGPRLAHALLPIAGKGGSDWSYAWVPIIGPIIGGVIGAFFFQACW